jgi:hypothetical protein
MASAPSIECMSVPVHLLKLPASQGLSAIVSRSHVVTTPPRYPCNNPRLHKISISNHDGKARAYGRHTGYRCAARERHWLAPKCVLKTGYYRAANAIVFGANPAHGAPARKHRTWLAGACIVPHFPKAGLPATRCRAQGPPRRNDTPSALLSAAHSVKTAPPRAAARPPGVEARPSHPARRRRRALIGPRGARPAWRQSGQPA